MINLRQIEAFVAIYEYGSVTKAAQHLHVTQSAASRLLSRLEYDLGFPLFVRIKGRLAATDEADAFYAEIQRNFLGMREISRAAGRIRELGTGLLKLSVMSSLTQGVVTDVVADFFRRHPGASGTFDVQSYGEVLNRVKRGISEIGIATLPVDERQFQVVPLVRNAAVCLVPRHLPLSRQASVSLRDLHGVDYVSVPLARYSGKIDRLFEQHQVRPNIRIETRTILGAVSLVAGGVGVSIIDPFCQRAIHDERIAVLPLEPSIDIEVGVLTSQDYPLSPLAKKFLGFVRQAIPREAPRLRR